MNCENCGHGNPDSAIFCNSCGNQFASEQDLSDTESLPSLTVIIVIGAITICLGGWFLEQVLEADGAVVPFILVGGAVMAFLGWKKILGE